MTDRTTPETSVAEPWRSEFDAFDNSYSARNGRRLASQDGVRETYYAAGYRTGVNDADAELLAALKMHVGRNGHTAGCAAVTTTFYGCSKRCTATRAAIAKAEGGAS